MRREERHSKKNIQAIFEKEKKKLSENDSLLNYNCLIELFIAKKYKIIKK